MQFGLLLSQLPHVNESRVHYDAMLSLEAAGLLTKAAAAVAGFKGAEALENLVEKKKDDEAADGDNTAAPDGDTSQA